MAIKRFDLDLGTGEEYVRTMYLGRFLDEMERAAIEGNEERMKAASRIVWTYTSIRELEIVSPRVEEIWRIYWHGQEGPRWKGKLRWS